MSKVILWCIFFKKRSDFNLGLSSVALLRGGQDFYTEILGNLWIASGHEPSFGLILLACETDFNLCIYNRLFY